MNTPVISGTYREIQIVNGEVIKNVELEEQVSPEKDVIKGVINGKPVFMERKLNPFPEQSVDCPSKGLS